MLAVASAEYLARLIQTQVYPGLFRRIVLDFLAAGEATVTRYELNCFSGKDSRALLKKRGKSKEGPSTKIHCSNLESVPCAK